MNNLYTNYFNGSRILRFAWVLWIMCFLLFVMFSVISITKNAILKTNTVDNIQSSVGLLPDDSFYKLKVLRNKIAEKIIIDRVKKIEFDLLMADKTILASKLLMEKGKNDLAAETALKGENYYSMLVQAYNIALIRQNKIPDWLDKKITQSAVIHQKIFKDLEKKSDEKNKKTFQVVTEFSKINYNFIVGLRNPKNVKKQ